MNFYGHAFLAAEVSRSPAFLFGSMLPDFCTMAGLRLVGADDEDVAAGVEHHHATDEVFHAAPTFVDLMGQGRDDLEAQGVRLGPAMAVGHVGVELLLDGWIWRSCGEVPYRAALSAGQTHAAGLRFRKQQGPQALLKVLERLLDLQFSATADAPVHVATRLKRILAPRPRLAMNEQEFEAVKTWAGDARAQVDARAPALLEEVRAGLAGQTPKPKSP